MPQSSLAAAASSSSAAGGGGGGGGLYLNAYEVSFPLEENIERPPPYHLNQEPVVQEPPHSQYSTFILISNLRAHLYVTLEKNAWLQKRIEELEEERNFLRCQLDRFIVSMRSPEGQRGVKIQPASSPSPPSPMTTRSGMTLKRIQGSGSRSRRNAGEEDKLLILNQQETKTLQQHCAGASHFMFLPSVKDPDGVLIRYKKILSTYQRVRSMSRAFQIHGVDRNTMASTSPIAELLLVAPEKVSEVGEFEASKEKLLDYARRCYKTMDDETHAKVQTMKKTHKLLPISYRFRN
uniref:Coiled-coil domain-containing protein 106-like n=1 Tax=Pundamilia nyererei TaxID=303518 RepID=A0A3B4F415_9CICH